MQSSEKCEKIEELEKMHIQSKLTKIHQDHKTLNQAI